MRDLVAVIVVVVLVVVALAMATSLQWYRRSHDRRRGKLRDRGQSIVAEVPSRDGLLFFSEDTEAFHWAERALPKTQIRAARVLISGASISTIRSRRFPGEDRDHPAEMEHEPESFERDRWDVAIEVGDDTVLVECGSIRERVSQELARRIFETVKRAIESLDGSTHHSRS